MKRIFFISVLIVFFIIPFVGCNNQQPSKEQSSITEKQLKVDYDLQEKCGKRSEEWVKKEYNGVSFTYNYKNHYNKKLNKCFVIVHYLVGSDYFEFLYDVNENNELGSISKMNKGMSTSCYISGKECKSKEEWDLLVKPYMEE